MDNELIMQRYGILKNKVVKREEQFKRFINFIENETEWLTSPASTKYHLCKKGGLLEHSINVAETMLKIKAAIAPETTDSLYFLLSQADVL